MMRCMVSGHASQVEVAVVVEVVVGESRGQQASGRLGQDQT
jgi:predicted DNA-binding protein with PD1-like motif